MIVVVVVKPWKRKKLDVKRINLFPFPSLSLLVSLTKKKLPKQRTPTAACTPPVQLRTGQQLPSTPRRRTGPPSSRRGRRPASGPSATSSGQDRGRTARATSTSPSA